MLKKTKWNEGDIAELLSPTGKRGFARILRKDDGWGVVVHAFKHNPTGWSSEIVYVNPYSIRHWTRLVKLECDLPDSPAVNDLVFFFGSSQSRWTVQSKEGTTYVDAQDATFEEMKARGYLRKTLWLAKDIENYIDGKPLVFPFDP